MHPCVLEKEDETKEEQLNAKRQDDDLEKKVFKRKSIIEAEVGKNVLQSCCYCCCCYPSCCCEVEQQEIVIQIQLGSAFLQTMQP